MRATHPPSLSKTHLLRLIVWAKAMVLWAVAMLLCDRAGNRRHIRQRYGALSIARLTRLVRNVMIIRAGQLSRHRPVRPWRNFAPEGFQRRRGICRLRSVAGSRLRRFLHEGDFAARLTRLVHIVRNLDAYVQSFLARRAKNGLARLNPLIAVRPAPRTMHPRAAQTPAFADSS